MTRPAAHESPVAQPDRRAGRWLFAAVSPGGPDRMDAGVATVVRDAADLLRATPEAERWFFLRYFDRRGPHLRLRVRARDRDDLDAVQHRLWPRLQDGVRRAQETTDVVARRPLLPSPPGLELPDGRHAGVEHRVYERELRKWGGHDGTAIAEDLFEASSDAVLALDGETLGTGERAALALTLMEAALRAVPADEHARFWDGYAAWWCGAKQRPRQYPALRRGIDGAAAKARGPLTAAARRRAGYDGAAGALDAYAAAVGRMLADARAAGIERDVPHLCFHHVHMTNNRLGITLTEEALLGAVLAGVAQEDHA
ncbi:thiopeptide-type bacteriocin biosynthesis protein [Patulibacter minatonensis]|uniref:thiopeptide-type bacteriocin biosynthesis protein n=1 Tax=Patulibacter minatonensis TaxID=298163 RepID=UPI0004BCC2DD|nr:thiopeptide-type bacteriocin biosynthesis protein [Patulibacter minatonensis]